jgi:hypothetical protein
MTGSDEGILADEEQGDGRQNRQLDSVNRLGSLLGSRRIHDGDSRIMG